MFQAPFKGPRKEDRGSQKDHKLVNSVLINTGVFLKNKPTCKGQSFATPKDV
jgi:hypothetical protein